MGKIPTIAKNSTLNQPTVEGFAQLSLPLHKLQVSRLVYKKVGWRRQYRVGHVSCMSEEKLVSTGSSGYRLGQISSPPVGFNEVLLSSCGPTLYVHSLVEWTENNLGITQRCPLPGSGHRRVIPGIPEITPP